jgi:exodeoxyribonuclease VII large subunit
VRLERLSARLRPELLARGVAGRRATLDERGRRLDAAAAGLMRQRQGRVAGLARLLGSLSYKGTLARGYAVVRDGAGEILTHHADAQAASGLEIEFSDGRLRIGGAAPPKTPRSGRDATSGQGSLF